MVPSGELGQSRGQRSSRNSWDDRNAREPAGCWWCGAEVEKTEEVKHIHSLKMEQTCETVIQATKNSLVKGLDVGVFECCADLQESAPELKRENGFASAYHLQL